MLDSGHTTVEVRGQQSQWSLYGFGMFDIPAF